MKRTGKKLLITIVFFVVIWTITWVLLYNYESTLPNSSIKAFANSQFFDLENIKIIKNPLENNIFEIYDNEQKILKVSATKKNKKWNVNLIENYISPFILIAPVKSDVYLNNVLISADSSDTLNDYSIITNQNDLPATNSYTLQGYLHMPNLSVKTEIGSLCELITKKRTIIASMPLSGAQLHELSLEIKDVGKLYARYITNDAKFAELSKKLYKDTAYYKEVQNFFNDWYAHSGYEFRDVKTENIIQTSPNSFEGDISFVYVQKKGSKEFTFDANYHIPFIKIDEKWLAVLIEIK